MHSFRGISKQHGHVVPARGSSPHPSGRGRGVSPTDIPMLAIAPPSDEEDDAGEAALRGSPDAPASPSVSSTPAELDVEQALKDAVAAGTAVGSAGAANSSNGSRQSSAVLSEAMVKVQVEDTSACSTPRPLIPPAGTGSPKAVFLNVDVSDDALDATTPQVDVEVVVGAMAGGGAGRPPVSGSFRGMGRRTKSGGLQYAQQLQDVNGNGSVTVTSPANSDLSGGGGGGGGKLGGIGLPTSRRESLQSIGSVVLGGASGRTGSFATPRVGRSRRNSFRGAKEKERDGLTDTEVAQFKVLYAQFDSDMIGTVDFETVTEMVLLASTIGMTAEEVQVEVEHIIAEVGCTQDRCTCEVLLRYMEALKKETARHAWKKMVSNLDMVIDNLAQKPSSEDQSPSTMVHNEYLRHTWLMLSDSTLRWAHDAMVVGTTVYYLVMVPLVITGPGHLYSGVPALLYLECVWTAVLFADILIRVNTVVVDTSQCNRVVTDRYELAQRYFLSWGFAVDVASALPLDIALHKATPGWAFICFQALRLLKVLRLNTVFEYSNLGVLTASHVTVRYNYVPLCRMVLNSALFVHFFACCYILASCEGSDEGCREQAPSPHRYLVAVYWTLYTVSSVGYGDVSIDNTWTYLLASVLFVAAVIVNGWVIGKISSYIAHMDVEAEHRVMMNRTLQVIKHFRLHDDVTSDILALQEHLYSQKVHLRSFQDVFDGLPGPVQAVLQLYLRVEYLSQVRMFRLFSAEGRIELAQALMQRVFARGEYIVVQDEIGEAFTVLVHGFAQVVKNGHIVANAFRGAFFGEDALLNDTVHCASVKCVTYAEVLVLEKDAFHALIARFPYIKYHLACEAAIRRGEPPPAAPQEFARMASGSHSPAETTLDIPQPPTPRTRRRDTQKGEDMCVEVYRHLGRKRLEERAHIRLTHRSQNEEDNLARSTFLAVPRVDVDGGPGAGAPTTRMNSGGALMLPTSPVTRQVRREGRPPPLCATALGVDGLIQQNSDFGRQASGSAGAGDAAGHNASTHRAGGGGGGGSVHVSGSNGGVDPGGLRGAGSAEAPAYDILAQSAFGIVHTSSDDMVMSDSMRDASPPASPGGHGEGAITPATGGGARSRAGSEQVMTSSVMSPERPSLASPPALAASGMGQSQASHAPTPPDADDPLRLPGIDVVGGAGEQMVVLKAGLTTPELRGRAALRSPSLDAGDVDPTHTVSPTNTFTFLGASSGGRPVGGGPRANHRRISASRRSVDESECGVSAFSELGDSLSPAALATDEERRDARRFSRDDSPGLVPAQPRRKAGLASGVAAAGGEGGGSHDPHEQGMTTTVDGADTVKLLQYVLHNQRVMFKKVSQLEKRTAQAVCAAAGSGAQTPAHPTRGSSMRYDSHKNLKAQSTKSKSGVGLASIFREC